MNNLSQRLKKFENKKHFDNKDLRELERIGAEVKAGITELGIDPKQYDFSDYIGIMRAWVAGLDAYLLTNYVDKAGNPIPASEMLKRIESYKTTNQ